MRVLLVALGLGLIAVVVRRLLAVERRLTALSDQQIQLRIDTFRRLEALEQTRPPDPAGAADLIQIKPARRPEPSP